MTSSRPDPQIDRALASAEAVADRAFQQVLIVRRGSREWRMIAAGQFCAGKLVLSLLTPQGIELVRLEQQGDVVEVDHARGLPAQVTPQAILSDFQLVHWPPGRLRAAWGPSWQLRTQRKMRRALYQGTRWVTVKFDSGPWGGTARLTHHHFGYELIIRTLRHRAGSRRAGCSKSMERKS